MKSATSLTPPSTGLSGIQFSILNVLEYPEGPEKNITTLLKMKSGRLFTAATQHLTPAIVKLFCFKYEAFIKSS